MAIFNGMFPVLPGKEADGKAFAQEVLGDRRDEFEERQGKTGVTRESWSLQETPMGSFVLVWFEADDPAAPFLDLATDDSDYTSWFVGQVKDICGVDLAAPPEGAMPETILEWSA
ncbi:MAG: hypothetical protein JWN46_3782 [Acidimicrobiales bacterium]|nr:hypothetical protein [Acidimicrobiales bacterium]